MGVITVSVLGAVLALSAAVHLQLVREVWLLLSLRKVFLRFQVWRLFTSLLYSGPFGVSLLLHLFFLGTYLLKLEDEAFVGRPVDLAYMLLCGGFWIAIFGAFMKRRLLTGALPIFVVMVWCRKNERAQLHFFGVQMAAPYFPWVLLLLQLLLGADVVPDLLGALAGHTYIFLTDVLPHTHGVRLLSTPAVVHKVLGPMLR
eukprot:RCo033642